jgi:hypothetical protein
VAVFLLIIVSFSLHLLIFSSSLRLELSGNVEQFLSLFVSDNKDLAAKFSDKNKSIIVDIIGNILLDRMAFSLTFTLVVLRLN